MFLGEDCKREKHTKSCTSLCLLNYHSTPSKHYDHEPQRFQACVQMIRSWTQNGSAINKIYRNESHKGWPCGQKSAYHITFLFRDQTQSMPSLGAKPLQGRKDACTTIAIFKVNQRHIHAKNVVRLIKVQHGFLHHLANLNKLKGMLKQGIFFLRISLRYRFLRKADHQ